MNSDSLCKFESLHMEPSLTNLTLAYGVEPPRTTMAHDFFSELYESENELLLIC